MVIENRANIILVHRNSHHLHGNCHYPSNGIVLPLWVYKKDQVCFMLYRSASTVIQPWSFFVLLCSFRLLCNNALMPDLNIDADHKIDVPTHISQSVWWCSNMCSWLSTRMDRLYTSIESNDVCAYEIMDTVLRFNPEMHLLSYRKSVHV